MVHIQTGTQAAGGTTGASIRAPRLRLSVPKRRALRRYLAARAVPADTPVRRVGIGEVIRVWCGCERIA